jgi:AraC-like DNA-binding protein
MPDTLENLSETHILGPRNRIWAVRASVDDQRPFLAGSPVCPGLGRYHVAHLGVQSAAHPYRIVRTHQQGTFFMACLDGEGRVLADGRWEVVAAGTACLLLPHMLNAFHAIPRRPWEFCWVRFRDSPSHQPLVPASSPRLARFDATALRHAILGLHHECSRSPAPDTTDHWIDLIQAYVLRFIRPWQSDSRLAQLWEEVASKLSEDWTLDRLASRAHVSGEHLRRLCQRELGRSPMHHVTFLRMRRAAELLATTHLKIEIIAGEVGYQNPFVFSNSFKKWTGWRPSDYPGRRAPAPPKVHFG